MERDGGGKFTKKKPKKEHFLTEVEDEGRLEAKPCV